MNQRTRSLAALLLAGLAVAPAACGDDNDEKVEQIDKDAGPDGEKDSGTPKADGGTDTPDDVDGGPGPVEVVETCPDVKWITDEDGICVISAAAGNEITEDLELKPVKDHIGYLLTGIVYVGEDVGGDAAPVAGKKTVTLTIKPGTVLVGDDNFAALAINRGSKIDAVGTASAPIRFIGAPAAKDEAAKPGDWGGLIIQGRAPTNLGPTATTELGSGQYGGPDADDDSGKLSYVRVEFPGGRIDDTHEFNGISFYGVGAGTTVDHVQVHGCGDDAFEFFGGTVNAKYLVASGGGDDMLDWTDGFVGNVQFVTGYHWDKFGDNGIEADNRQGNEGLAPVSNPTLANLTLIGTAGSASGDGYFGARLRRGTQAQIWSSVFVDFSAACLSVENGSQAFAADGTLALKTSAISCATSFNAQPVAPAVPAAKVLFDKSADNQELTSSDLFRDTAQSDAFDPRLKAGSALLTGGASPADTFFTKVAYIGAFGEDNWLAGWTSFPAYAAPAK